MIKKRNKNIQNCNLNCSRSKTKQKLTIRLYVQFKTVTTGILFVYVYMSLKTGWCWGAMLFCLHLDVPINDKRGRGGILRYPLEQNVALLDLSTAHSMLLPRILFRLFSFSNMKAILLYSYPIKTEVPVVHNSRWNHNKIVPVTLLTEVLTRVITHPRFWTITPWRFKYENDL